MSNCKRIFYWLMNEMFSIYNFSNRKLYLYQVLLFKNFILNEYIKNKKIFSTIGRANRLNNLKTLRKHLEFAVIGQ